MLAGKLKKKNKKNPATTVKQFSEKYFVASLVDCYPLLTHIYIAANKKKKKFSRKTFRFSWIESLNDIFIFADAFNTGKSKITVMKFNTCLNI